MFGGIFFLEIDYVFFIIIIIIGEVEIYFLILCFFESWLLLIWDFLCYFLCDFVSGVFIVLY